jgi:D-beta-D-heptose 7-phosphate kinase/D-beta-D-heptose 1-phosphate adenosyltransferase
MEKTAEQRLPGGAANVAAILRARDADVYLLSIIGDDIPGTLQREERAQKRGQ